MTLVVARQKGKSISLVSDTGISGSGKQFGIDQQMPKILIAHPQLAIGFSGSPELALRSFTDLPDEANATYAAVTQHLLTCHRNYNVDFIVGFGEPLFKLAIVSGDTIRQKGAFEWIGDQAGFEAYQRFRAERSDKSIPFITPMLSTTQENEKDHPTFDMIGSIRHVIGLENIKSVFGHPVAVSNADGFFSYRSFSISLEEKASFAMPRSVDPAIVLDQIREAQSYSFSCFVSTPTDPVQAVAYHYLRGKLTYIYFGARGSPIANFRKFEGLNAVELQDRVKEEYGINWIGGLFSRTGIPSEYGIPAADWRVQGSKRELKS